MATYAVMQSQVEFSGPFTPHLLAPKAMLRHQKPKLSLDTTPHRSFGRASTGLRLETLSPSSPTRSNTYKNSYDPQIKTPQDESSLSPPKPPNTQPQLLDGQSSSLQGADDCPNDITHLSQVIPYALTSDIRSILTNGPLAKRQRSIQTPITASSTTSGSAFSLPPVKRVCFRDPVSEDIQTTQYLLKHSDLRSRSISPVPNTSDSSQSHEATSAHVLPPKAREVAPRARQSEDDEDEADKNNDDCTGLPKTPIAGRNKKEREWIWTLGPVPGLKEPGSSISSDESSDEDLDDSLGETVAAASGFL